MISTLMELCTRCLLLALPDPIFSLQFLLPPWGWSVWTTRCVMDRSYCVAQGAQSGSLWWPRRMGWGQGWKAREAGNVCIIMADFHYCMVENNRTLQNKIKWLRKRKEKKTKRVSLSPCFLLLRANDLGHGKRPEGDSGVKVGCLFC